MSNPTGSSDTARMALADAYRWLGEHLTCNRGCPTHDPVLRGHFPGVPLGAVVHLADHHASTDNVGRDGVRGICCPNCDAVHLDRHGGPFNCSCGWTMICHGNILHAWPIALSPFVASRGVLTAERSRDERSGRPSQVVLMSFMWVMFATVACMIGGMISDAPAFLFLTVWGSMASVALLIFFVTMNTWEFNHGWVDE